MELVPREMTEYHWAASTMWADVHPSRGLKILGLRLSKLRMSDAQQSRSEEASTGATHLGRSPLGMGDDGRYRDDSARGPHLDRHGRELRDREGDRPRTRPSRGHRRDRQSTRLNSSHSS